jgi:DnaA-homolog protein
MNQLPLALRWPRRQRFEHFHAGANAAAVAALKDSAQRTDASWLFVSGAQGSGKTHLLMATCQAAAAHSRRVQYLPLGSLRGALANAIRGSAGCDLLALDDVQALAGDSAAEHALFDVYNRAHDEGTTLLFAADAPPAQLSVQLPDLRSRLGACSLLALKPLSEPERRTVLHEHAAARGIELEDSVLDWLFTRYARDLGALHELLEQLDSASLAARRRITVPFLRDYLKERDTKHE